MDYQGALRARLLAAAPVSALVGNRIYWVERPQSSALPAITLTAIPGEREQTMKEFQALQFVRVQVDCWAPTYALATALAEAVIAAAVPVNISNGVNFRRASVEGPRDLGEQIATGFVHRKQLDLIIRHSPA